jgi:hypothetical protein
MIDTHASKGLEINVQTSRRRPMNVVWDGSNATITEAVKPSDLIVVYFTKVNILTGEAVSGFDTKAGWKRMRVRNSGKCSVH